MSCSLTGNVSGNCGRRSQSPTRVPAAARQPRRSAPVCTNEVPKVLKSSRNVNDVLKKALDVLRQHVHPTKTMNRSKAIILDIDDTAIMSSPRGTKLVLPAFHELYEEALSHGFRIYFVTARLFSPSNLTFTRQQLQVLGFPKYDGLFLMPEMFLNAKNFSVFKYSVRKALVDKSGLEILLNVGDNLSDLMLLPPYVKPTKATRYLKSLDPKNTYLLECIELAQFAIKLPLRE